MSVSKISCLFLKRPVKSEFGGNESEFGKIWTKNHQKHPFLRQKMNFVPSKSIVHFSN